MAAIESRLNKLELARREQCAASWAEVVTRLSKLPLPVIKQLMETGTAPIEYAPMLDEMVTLFGPLCQEYAERHAP